MKPPNRLPVKKERNKMPHWIISQPIKIALEMGTVEYCLTSGGVNHAITT